MLRALENGGGGRAFYDLAQDLLRESGVQLGFEFFRGGGEGQKIPDGERRSITFVDPWPGRHVASLFQNIWARARVANVFALAFARVLCAGYGRGIVRVWSDSATASALCGTAGTVMFYLSQMALNDAVTQCSTLNAARATSQG